MLSSYYKISSTSIQEKLGTILGSAVARLLVVKEGHGGGNRKYFYNLNFLFTN